MEVWVRSQRKTNLVSVKSVSYNNYCQMDKYHHRIL